MNQPSLMVITLMASLLFPLKISSKPVDKAGPLRRVYARLLHTMGAPADAPILRLLARGESGADSYVVYRPGRPARIEMSEAVLDLCTTFGPDTDAALACLLGHELAHFQYRHGGKQGFFSPVIMPNGAPYSSENLEALADKSGVFMAYLAGYDAFTIAPAVYRKLYDTFKLSDQLSGYPTKTQRLRMVADTTARVQELAQLFELGEVCYLLHDYEAASRAFSTLVARYPTAITLNNLGAIKLNQALARMNSARDEARLRFAFPVEFDADNRLLATPRRGEPLPYQALLTDAQHLFQTALAEQPAYQPAILNGAITHYLLEQSEEARQLLTARKPLTANASLMLAIVQADLGEPANARRLFQQAVEQGAYRAADNAKLFEESRKPGWLRYWSSLTARRQMTKTITKPVPIWPTVPTPTLPMQPVPLPGGFRYARTDSLTVYELTLNENGKNQRYRVLKSHRLGLRALPVGSSRSRLSVYAAPTSIVAGGRGSLFYEYRRGMQCLFLEYQNDRLIGWTYVTG